MRRNNFQITQLGLNPKEGKKLLSELEDRVEALAKPEPKAKGICGPSLLALLAAIPVAIRRALKRA